MSRCAPERSGLPDVYSRYVTSDARFLSTILSIATQEIMRYPFVDQLEDSRLNIQDSRGPAHDFPLRSSSL